MKPLLLTSILAAVAVVGCGGKIHEPAAVADTPASSFVGTWSGTYVQSDGAGTGVAHRKGTVYVTIAQTASSAPSALSGVGISGTAQDSERGAGTFEGFIVDQEPTDGIGQGSSMNASFPSSPANDIYKGRPKIDARGHIVGPVYLFLGDFSVPTQLDLTPVASPG